MVASCCVLNCRRTIPTDKKEPRLSLHRYAKSIVNFQNFIPSILQCILCYNRFPTRNLEIRKKWIKAAGLGRPKDWKPKDHDVVCSVHFNELDYYPDQQMRRLREEAVPSNFVKESYAVCFYIIASTLSAAVNPKMVFWHTLLPNFRLVKKNCQNCHHQKIKMI